MDGPKSSADIARIKRIMADRKRELELRRQEAEARRLLRGVSGGRKSPSTGGGT